MKDKNLPPDNNSQSLEELTKEANNIIESLEEKKIFRIQLILTRVIKIK